jgi:hypothetical protein
LPIAQSRRAGPPEPSKALGANARTLITDSPRQHPAGRSRTTNLFRPGGDDCDAGNSRACVVALVILLPISDIMSTKPRRSSALDQSGRSARIACRSASHNLNGHDRPPADAAGIYAVSPSACVSVILRSRYHEKYPWYLSCRSRRRQSCPSITRRQEAVLQRQVICPS